MGGITVAFLILAAAVVAVVAGTEQSGKSRQLITLSLF